MPAATPVVPHASDATFRGVQRQLARLLPGAPAPGDTGSLLELYPSQAEPARLIAASVVEGTTMRAHRVFDSPQIGFAAFLDGTQASRVVCYVEMGVPIVHGTTAAVIRVRRNRRMATWRHTVQHRVYAPRALLRAGLWDQLVDFGIAVVDTSESLEQGTSPHPFVLREAAVHRVQKDREVAERELAERWCALETEPLFVDGSISGSDGVARGSCAVGVVKSHRTLYASDDALNTVLRLRHAERSSVFSVTSPRRATVASWYLRMRDPAGRDPMWGLVRVEVGENEAGTAKGISARADEVSRWILAEAAPLALPDPRWDRMVYGIRDCEEFLKAIQG